MSRGLMLFLLILPSASRANAQDVPHPGVTVTVQELESSLQIGADRNSSVMRLAARVTVKNDSGQPMLISRNQFELHADGTPIEPGLLESSPQLEPATLQPLQFADGWIWYSFIQFNGREPKMTLTWTSEHDEPSAKAPKAEDSSASPKPPTVEIDLNQEFRRLGAIEKERLGPEGCLLQITVRRSLDVLAAWTLQDELKHAAAAGIQRITFVPGSDVAVGATQPVVTDEFAVWLATMTEQLPGETVAVSPFPKTEARFKHLSLGGIAQSANRRFNAGRGSVQIHPRPEDSICAALTPLYRFVPVKQAIADLRHAHAGIRRAAMAGSVDRLTAEQATVILEQAQTGNEELQIEVATYLNLIPGRESVDTLKTLSLCGKAKVSAVALRSLASCQDNATAAAMAEVWKAGESSPALQAEIVTAILETQDDRWTPLVAACVAEFLSQSVSHDAPVPPVEQTAENPPSESDEPAQKMAAPVPGTTGPPRDDSLTRMAGALEFLRDRGHQDTVLLVRRSLLNIDNPVLQDLFLDNLMRAGQHDCESVIRKCVEQRLQSRRISNSVRSAAMLYRDSAWTEALLADSAEDADHRPAHLAMQAVLQCASPKQLDGLMQRFGTMNAVQKEQLLSHLALAGHAGWQDLAAELMETPGPLSSEAIVLLGQDASEQSLSLLRLRLEAYAAGLEGTPDASIEGQRFMQALMTQVSMFAHPECRRLMNRLARDPNEFLSDNAMRRVFEAVRRSPAFPSLDDAIRQRGAGQLDDELLSLNNAAELDPLLPEIFVRRASALMHAARFEEAMTDLETADRLSPEDIEVLSLIAIVQVRMGQLETGVGDAEEVIALSPKNWISLYNGACTFARAAESPASTSDQKLKFADRAVQLLLETADLKFSDVEHMQKDADLTALYGHVMWPEVVNRVTANKVKLAEGKKPGE